MSVRVFLTQHIDLPSGRKVQAVRKVDMPVPPWAGLILKGYGPDEVGVEEVAYDLKHGHYEATLLASDHSESYGEAETEGGGIPWKSDETDVEVLAKYHLWGIMQV